MNKLFICKSGGLATFLAAAVAAAQDSGATRIYGPIDPVSTNRNHIGLSYTMGFGVSATFKHFGGYAVSSALSPRTTPSGDPYNYDNGYIYADQTTASGHPGYTWYYGYGAETPVGPAGAATDFTLTRSSSAPDLSSRNQEGDPQHGLEVTLRRHLGKAGHAFWGIEAALGFTDVGIQDNHQLLGTVTRTADTFRTGGGAILRPAPQAFPFEGPGEGDANGWPLVRLEPVPNGPESFSGAALATGSREFNASILSFRLAPYYEIPLSARLSWTLSGGLLLMGVLSDFKYNETVTLDPTITLAELPAQNHRGSGSKSEVLAGGFLGTVFSYSLNERLSLFAGGQIQFLPDYTHTESGKSAHLNFGGTVLASFGVSYGF